MNRIYISQLPHHVGERVQLAGWLHRLRTLSRVDFLLLRDRTGIGQIVLSEPTQREMLTSLNAETVLQVEGTVIATPQAPGGVELHDAHIEVIAPAHSPPPFDLFRPTLKAQLPTILDHAALSLRFPRRRAFFQITAASMQGFRSTLGLLGFTEIQTPKIVASATESGANVFGIDYFGAQAYLAQSPQLYKQIMVGVFERVFEVGPVFRAEPHATSRHLAQYSSLDVEMGFIEDHHTVMQVLTEVVRGMIDTIQAEAGAAVELLSLALPEVPNVIPELHFSDAKELYFQETGNDTRTETDLSPDEEKWLGIWVQREHGSDFLFVIGYPMAKRPFYTHPELTRPGYSNSFDLLFKGLELVTGGQRLHRYEDYLTVMKERNMSLEPFEGYLEAFKYGMPPHGGFAIGLERWIARLAGVANIRETTLFPRDMQRLQP